MSSRSFRLVAAAAAAMEATEAVVLQAATVVPAMLLTASGVEQWMLEDVVLRQAS